MALFFLLLFSCAHKTETPAADDVFAKLTTGEKYKMLRAYRFIQSSLDLQGGADSPHGFFPGVPRLGIPAIEFIGNDHNSRDIAREEKTLKLGYVNLISSNEKTQVYGNFEKARAVEEILGPGNPDLDMLYERGELKDLDLFIVHEGTEGNIRKFVCTHWQVENRFHCVRQKLDDMIAGMGMTPKKFDQAIEEEKLKPAQLNKLSREVIVTLSELKLL